MSSNVIDSIPLGGIVAVRDRLLAMQGRGVPVMRMESGDPSFPVPEHIREAIEKALRDGYTHYVASIGIPAFREAACRKLRDENRLPVKDAAHVLATNGGMHGLYVAFRALCEPGDEVILPDPTWPETAEHIRLALARPVRCPLDPEHGYAYDPDRIASLITNRTRAIVVNTPHNPTGSVVELPALERILQLAECHGLYVLSDEAYEHVIYDGREHLSIGSLPGAGDRVVSIYSLSKSYAMSGLRLGYLTTNDDRLVGRMTKLLRCTSNGINAALQIGGAAAISGPQAPTRDMCRTYEQRRDLVVDGLRRVPVFRAVRPAGAFYVWAQINPSWGGQEGRNDSWAMVDYLIDRAGIGTCPGVAFGPSGEGHIRFAFSCATEQVAGAVAKIQDLFAWERWCE